MQLILTPNIIHETEHMIRFRIEEFPGMGELIMSRGEFEALAE